MSSTLNQPAFQRLIDENREWLGRQPRTLERDHIDLILRLVREIPPRRLETIHEEFPATVDPLPMEGTRLLAWVDIDRGEIAVGKGT